MYDWILSQNQQTMRRKLREQTTEQREIHSYFLSEGLPIWSKTGPFKKMMSLLKSRGKIVLYDDLMKAWSDGPKSLSTKERLKAETRGISDMWTVKIFLS